MRGKYARKRALRGAFPMAALEITFSSPITIPRKPEVVRKLEAISFDMTKIKVGSGGPLGMTIQPYMEVQALRRNEHPYMLPTITLFGEYATYNEKTTDAEIVAKARDLLIHLITHEIDEVLFVAGLGPDPHAPEVAAELETLTLTLSA